MIVHARRRRRSFIPLPGDPQNVVDSLYGSFDLSLDAFPMTADILPLPLALCPETDSSFESRVPLTERTGAEDDARPHSKAFLGGYRQF